MEENQDLTSRFQAQRGQLRAVAYRLLGSVAEAEDAVQEAWFRLHRSDLTEVRNLGGWLTTVVARVALDMLRSRSSRQEDPLGVHLPDPIVGSADDGAPEDEAVLADSVGFALLVVLESLAPAERLAFVLHDMFAVPFGEIGDILGRSPAATKQLASRARARLQGETHSPETDVARQREVVDAFLAASRQGDFEALLGVLHPDVLLKVDTGAAPAAGSRLLRGAREVASQALLFSQYAQFARPVLVNGAVGLATAPNGALYGVEAFTIVDGRIVEIFILADPERMAGLDVTFLG